MKTQLQKWGNSLAIRIPREAVSGAELRRGDELELVVVRRGTLRVRRRKKRTSLAQLIKGINRKNRHSETDWGPAQGQEVW